LPVEKKVSVTRGRPKTRELRCEWSLVYSLLFTARQRTMVIRPKFSGAAVYRGGTDSTQHPSNLFRNKEK